MKRQHIFWRISVLLLIFTFGLGLNSCGTKSRSAGEPFSIQSDGIRLTAFDSAGNPSKELTQKLSLTEDMNESSGEYLIHASNVNGWSNLYIELEYSPTLHLSNIERGELFASGLMYYREVEAGKSILVLVNPGSQPQLESGSGTVGIIHLRNSGTEKVKPISAATDDPYIQETKEYEEAGQKYLEWTEVLRGDCNQNHKVDFADFGIIGARYNQTVNTADSVIDPNQNGKVEFSDFGEIGLRYSRQISGFSVYAMNYGSYSQVKQFSFTDQDSKIAPAGKNDKGWLKYKIPVEWISDGSSRVEPVSITSGQYYLIKKIGPAGGKIETNNFRLEIPAGAFDTDYTLEVQIQTQNLAMFESMCSSPYSIKGLPDKILKPLSVEFKYRAPVNQPIKGNRYVQLQERKQPLDVHNQNWLYGYHTFEVTQSGEWMKATIPISDSDPVAEEKSGSSELGRTTSAVTESFSIWAIAGYYSMLSSKKHFRITYPASDLIQGGAEQIAEHLEASYEKIESLGFSWSARTCWPIEVTIQPIIGTDGSPNSRWGEYVPSRWGINHYSLNLNANNMNNQTEINTMKLTSSHELFHILQAMYDARSWWAIATDPGRWYWMDEASAVWFETLMAPNPNEYIASVARDNSQFLFNNPLDFYTGDRLVVADHGYGASSFLKFFTKKHGNSVVAEMYKLHRKSTSYTPINALESVSKYNMIVDWNQFCQDYFEGLLYPQSSLSLAHRLKTASTFNVDRNVYSTNAYYGYLPGLSARLYAVSFAAVKDTIPAKTIAYFTNNYPPANDYALTTTVFRVKGNPEAVNKVGVLKKLGSNELNELLFDLMSPDVKNLAANGENLYVLIVNSDTKPDTIAQCLTTEICVPSDSATAAVYSMNYTSKETVFYHDWAKIDPKVTNTDMKGDLGVTFEPGPFQWTSDYHFKYLVENGFGAKKYLEGELSEDKHTVLWFKMEEQTSTSSLDISRKLEAKNIPLIAKKRFDVGYIPGFIYRIQSTAPEVVHYFVYNHSSIDPIEHSETVWENYKFPDSFIELYLYIPYK